MNNNVTVAEAFASFLRQPGRKPATKNKFRYKMRDFLATHGQRPLTAVTDEVLENWFEEELRGRGYSRGHLAFHRSCHHTFWKYCSQWTGHNPAASLPRYSQRPSRVVVAAEADVERALDVCARQLWTTVIEQRDAAIFALGTAGLRRSNISHMRYSDCIHDLTHPVTADGRQMYLLATEGKQPMEAVLDERRAKIIRRYVENRPSTRHDRLFVALDPRASSYLKPLGPQGYQKARRRVCRAAGVPLISFQQMRRLVGTKIARQHGALLAAQVLGHRSGVRVVLEHYYDPDREAARAAALAIFPPG